MKTGRRKSCLAVAKVIVLSVLAVFAVLFSGGCDGSVDFARAGAGTTVGIMGAGMAVELARDALLKGIKGIDKGQSSVSMHPSASSKLSEARKVAVLFEKPGELKMPSGGFMQGDQDVLQDSLTGLLMQMGYEVIGPDVLASAMKEDSSDRLQALKELGTELLIGGAVVSGIDHDMKMGIFMGRAKSHMKSVVDTTSLRITKCEDGQVIMTATVTYRKGKPAPDAAKDLAVIIQRARHGVIQ